VPDRAADDVTDRRRDRYWPRDGPIQWDRFAARLAFQIVAVVALVAHLVLAGVLVATLRTEPVDWLIAIAWIVLGLFGVWSWWFHRWRLVAAPVAIAGLMYLAGRLGG
jgi:hypothetical protein